MITTPRPTCAPRRTAVPPGTRRTPSASAKRRGGIGRSCRGSRRAPGTGSTADCAGSRGGSPASPTACARQSPSRVRARRRGRRRPRARRAAPRARRRQSRSSRAACAAPRSSRSALELLRRHAGAPSSTASSRAAQRGAAGARRVRRLGARERQAQASAADARAATRPALSGIGLLSTKSASISGSSALVDALRLGEVRRRAPRRRAPSSRAAAVRHDRDEARSRRTAIDGSATLSSPASSVLPGGSVRAISRDLRQVARSTP